MSDGSGRSAVRWVDTGLRSLGPMDDSSYQRLRIERREHGVMLLTLSNPSKLNATDAVLHAELARVFHDISHDE